MVFWCGAPCLWDTRDGRFAQGTRSNRPRSSDGLWRMGMTNTPPPGNWLFRSGLEQGEGRRAGCPPACGGSNQPSQQA